MTDAKTPAKSDRTDARARAGQQGGSTTAATPEPAKPAGSRDTGRKPVAGADALRNRIATVVWLVAVVCALFLAVGALVVALKMSPDASLVAFVTDTADALVPDVFRFTGEGAATRSALTNGGLAAVVCLVAGKILDRVIRP